jgi:hypothetical protein
MNDSVANAGDSSDSWDSRDCVDLILEGPGDRTVRPMRPVLRQHVLEQQERRARLMELWKQQQEQEKAKEASRTEKDKNAEGSIGP